MGADDDIERVIESRVSAIVAELQRDSHISGLPIDQRAVQTKIERDRKELLSSSLSSQYRDIFEAVSEEVANRLRIKLR